jgi:phosphate transport system permease protein
VLLIARLAINNPDRLFRWTTKAFALVVLAVTGFIAWQLFWQSRLAQQRFGLGFISGKIWDPVAEQFGALPFIYGTVVTSVIALLIAVPLGLGTAIFLAELAPARLSRWLSLLVELLAAIPSVIYGLVGIFVVVPWVRVVLEPALSRTLGFLPLFKGTPYGVGFLTAGIILATMIVPFITSISREVLLTVPNSQREAALALGATRWETLRMSVLPYARAGIAASILLALARALGETMAVTMVIGNRPQIVASLFEPGYTMAAVIANEFTEATGEVYLHALIGIGLVLFALTVVINGFARIILVRLSVKSGRV